MTIQRLTEQKAYEFCEKVVGLKENLEKGFIELAKGLYTIKEQRLYEGQYGTFDLYLDRARIGKSKAEQLIRMYEKFSLEYKIDDKLIVEAGGWSVVVRLLPMAKTRDLALKALENASQLPTRQSVVKWVKEAVEDDFKACTHEDYYVVKICRCCGERFKVDDSQKEE